MIFKISWAADPWRLGTVWFRPGMVLSCQINYQKFGEFMFGKIIIYKAKTDFHVQLFISLIPSDKESPIFIDPKVTPFSSYMEYLDVG